jgi:hypothetical protein
MRRFVSSSAAAGFPARASLALAAVLIAAPALAQTPAQPGTASDPAPKAGRSISSTGRTMPLRGQPPVEPSRPTSSTEAEMLKAQKANDARSKAWDTKMQKTMGSICHGC